ncbi:MAG: DUF3793 family protein [Planctomycetia bacterium]|nr:DUF3793 family protein [Planctomycetia bacterium]
MDQGCCECLKELLRFVLIRTAPVRVGIKPGELLRVKKCLRASGCHGEICVHQDEALRALALPYLTLRDTPIDSLLLFYHAECMERLLDRHEVRQLLAPFGYPLAASAPLRFFERLEERFKEDTFPHEVGIFLGYPLKDVEGFLYRLPETHVSGARWRVFGEPTESLMQMKAHCCVEQAAERILATSPTVEVFYNTLRSSFRNRSVT